MTKAVSCTIKINSQAENILEELHSIGFSNQNVSILFPDRIDTKKWVDEKHTKAPEGAVAGASAGGVIGGVLGWLAGMGGLAIPGVGPFIAAGPILSALSGSAIGAAMGGMTGALVGLGMPEYEAKIYENKIKEGLIIISAQTQDREAEKRAQARKIFQKANASDISEIYEVAEVTGQHVF